MKKITMSILAAALLAVGMQLSAATPEQFVPEKAIAVSRLNARALMDLPIVQSGLEKARKDNPADSQLMQELGFDPQNFIAGEIWSAINADSSNMILLIKTGVNEQQFAAMLKKLTDKAPANKVKVTNAGGKKVYSVKFADQEKFANKTLAATYLADDVIMLAEDKPGLQDLILAAQSGGNNPLIKKLNRQALWAIYGNTDAVNEQFFSVDFALDIVGSPASILQINCEIVCKSAELAQQTAMQMQFIVPSFAGMIFGKEPKLTQTLLTGLAIDAKDKILKVKYHLNTAELDNVVKYLETHTKKLKPNQVKAPTVVQGN